jgi:hypothetical protein
MFSFEDDEPVSVKQVIVDLGSADCDKDEDALEAFMEKISSEAGDHTYSPSRHMESFMDDDEEETPDEMMERLLKSGACHKRRVPKRRMMTNRITLSAASNLFPHLTILRFHTPHSTKIYMMNMGRLPLYRTAKCPSYGSRCLCPLRDQSYLSVSARSVT